MVLSRGVEAHVLAELEDQPRGFVCVCRDICGNDNSRSPSITGVRGRLIPVIRHFAIDEYVSWTGYQCFNRTLACQHRRPIKIQQVYLEDLRLPTNRHRTFADGIKQSCAAFCAEQLRIIQADESKIARQNNGRPDNRSSPGATPASSAPGNR